MAEGSNQARVASAEESFFWTLVLCTVLLTNSRSTPTWKAMSGRCRVFVPKAIDEGRRDATKRAKSVLSGFVMMSTSAVCVRGLEVVL